MTFGQDAGTCYEVRTGLERLFVRCQTVLGQVVAIDLGQTERKVEPPPFKHPNRRQRFGQTLRLALQTAADNADGVRIERGFDFDDVMHHIARHCQVGAAQEFHSR